MNNFERVKLLLRKNLRTKWRTRRRFGVQIFLMCLCIAVIILNPIAQMEPIFNGYNQMLVNPAMKIENISFIYGTVRPGINIDKMSLGYTPNNEIFTKIVQAAAATLKISDPTPFDNIHEMEKKIMEESLIAGIEFPKKLKDITEAPKYFAMSLIFPSEFRTFQSNNPWQNLWATHDGIHFGNKWDGTRGNDLYISEGFLQLQNALFFAYFNMIKTENTNIPEIRLHPFAHHTAENQKDLADASTINGLMFYLCFLFPCINLIREICREESENIMVHHTLNGFPYWVHWLSHFIAALIYFIILDAILIILLKIEWTPDLIETESYHYAHIVSMSLFLFLYNIAAILFCFVAVAICRDGNVAVFTAVILWVLMYSTFAVILKHSNEFGIGLVFGSLLFFNNAMAYGMRSLQTLNENTLEILLHSRIWCIFGMLLFDSLLYLLILCVTERLSSHPYMERRPLGCQRRRKTDQPPVGESDSVEVDKTDRESFEFKANVEAVRCSNISKFEKKRSLIENVSLKMYENEITVILGHSGAGKTALICIIAGLNEPSVGGLSIYGVDVSKANSVEVRKDICLCLPNNTLFDQLTVMEHLVYALNIKQVDETLKQFELIKWLNILNSSKLSKGVTAKLSFGKKRLLCLAMALCGRTKIVLLDEPTKHLTVKHRKLFWDIVRSHKNGHCIIVATDSMAEAESVGDRIAILNEGQLFAYGTLFFLKMKYAASYYLICLKNYDCETEEVTQLIRQFIPEVQLENETRDQIHYKISYEYVPQFAELFVSLEQQSTALGLVGVHVMGNQLSDVQTSILGEMKNAQPLYDRGQSVMIDMKLDKGYWLIRNQISAMFHKKLLYLVPNKLAGLMMILSIVLILILGHLSKFVMIENTQQKIDLGFRSQSESGSIFQQILDKNYNSRHQLVEIDGVHFEKEKSRGFTWTSSVESNTISHLDSSMSGVDISAISLPDNNSNVADVWFNMEVFHCAPMAMNLVHNAMLRMEFKTSDYKTSVENKPLPVPLHYKLELLEDGLSYMKLPLTIGAITPFMISSFIVCLVTERETNVRSLQFLAGIKIPIYWILPLCWDLCIVGVFLITFTIIFLLLTADNSDMEDKLATLLILIVYGYSTLCQAYLLSFCFTKPIESYLACSLSHLSKGLFAYVVYWDLLKKSVIFWWIAMFSPDFAMLDGMALIFIKHHQKNLCEEESKLIGTSATSLCKQFPKCCSNRHFKWDDSGILPSIAFMMGTGTFFLLTIIGVEYYSHWRRFDTTNTDYLHTDDGPYENGEVLDEKERIAEMNMMKIKEYNMVVDQLEYKIPKRGSTLKTISFAVQSNECLVILGERNSGKTHLIQQLIGEAGFSFGNIYVQGLNMKENIGVVRTLLGFCPKEKGLLKECTGKQLMRILCLIRGVPKKQVNLVINEMVVLLEMQDFIATKVEDLSMEKKRRINIAIAFLVDVQVLLIDEPTVGVSALPRRIIWNVLRYARFTGKSVVLTTTDPWECEALADQVIVYSDGDMLFYGTLQHLRNKYGNGIILEVKIRKDGHSYDEVQQNLENDISSIRRFITFIAVDSELRSTVDGTLRFYIPIKSMVWSRLFDLIEKNRERLHIENYIVNQASFEEVMHNLMAARKK